MKVVRCASYRNVGLGVVISPPFRGPRGWHGWFVVIWLLFWKFEVYG